MSIRQSVCCNAKGIMGQACTASVELNDRGGLPTGWISLLAMRRPTIDDLLRSEHGRIFGVMREQLQSMGAEGIKMIEQMIAQALEVAPRISVEAHLCSNHAGSMPIVEWQAISPDE